MRNFIDRGRTATANGLQRLADRIRPNRGGSDIGGRNRTRANASAMASGDS